MAKANKKNKKSKKNGNSSKGFHEAINTIIAKIKTNRKAVITISCILLGIILIFATVFTVKTIKKRNADRTVRIAFFDLDETYIDILKAKIAQEDNIILKIDVLTPENFKLEDVKNNYDMLFTWRGEVTDALCESAEKIPEKIQETMPRSLRSEKCLPIFLDHFEIAYKNEILKKTEMEIPYSFEQFQDYLNAAKSYVFSPFFCNGAEDRILIDFIGAIVMAKGGLKAYNKLIDELRNLPEASADFLDAIIDIDLDDRGCTVRSILELLKTWPKEGLTHPAWFNGLGNDLLYFAQANQLGCFFTSLSEHRKIPYNVIKNYESALVPSNQDAGNYGLIAPAVSVMLISDNSNCKRYLAEFFTEDAQADFSNLTNMAPVHYRAQAYDRQADDVRFWAASCAGGAVPDLYLAAFQLRIEDLKKLCDEIRTYVR